MESSSTHRLVSSLVPQFPHGILTLQDAGIFQAAGQLDNTSHFNHVATSESEGAIDANVFCIALDGSGDPVFLDDSS